MTDKDIIKALECCLTQRICDGCPLVDKYANGACRYEAKEKALDLINRLQEEKQEITEKFNCQQTVYVDLSKIIKDQKAEINERVSNSYKLKAEAVEEFAERLKAKAVIHNCRYGGCLYDITAVRISDIDNLVKEMVGEG